MTVLRAIASSALVSCVLVFAFLADEGVMQAAWATPLALVK